MSFIESVISDIIWHSTVIDFFCFIVDDEGTKHKLTGDNLSQPMKKFANSQDQAEVEELNKPA